MLEWGGFPGDTAAFVEFAWKGWKVMNDWNVWNVSGATGVTGVTGMSCKHTDAFLEDLLAFYA